MADKDQFTFDDDDDFPETDLSAAFAEGEHSAEDPVQDLSATKVKGGGNSRTRILLIVLLLVVAGAAGAYYFMGLGGKTPSVPVPAQTTSKSVALPPQPARPPQVQTPAEPAETPVTVAVPPPPSADAEPAATATAAPAEQPVAGQTQTQSTEPPAAQAIVPSPQPVTELQAPVTAEQPQKPVPQAVAAAAVPAEEPVKASAPVSSSAPVAGGAYTLDAGSYLLESNRDELVAKIRKLGYEPLVTPVDATLNMTRLRLGTFSKDEVQEALAFARTIEPGSYSTPAGDRFVIYAGTFHESGNVDKLTRRFLDEGIKVHPEPVQVVRTLSRIRFGAFATREDAAAAAREVGKAGFRASVVKSR